MKRIWAIGLVVLCACHQVTTRQKAVEEHYLEIRERGKGRIYLDKVANRQVMVAKQEDTGKSHFVSYRVSFEDSVLITDIKKQQERGRYYQYEMEKDWIMLVNGDSIRAVFAQPFPKHSLPLTESIVVFELSEGLQPDTLFYRDSYGYWGQHFILLNK